MLPLNLQSLFIQRSARSALALEQAEQGGQVASRRGQSADDGDDLASPPFFHRQASDLLLGWDLSGSRRRACAVRFERAAAVAFRRSIVRCSLKESHLGSLRQRLELFPPLVATRQLAF